MIPSRHVFSNSKLADVHSAETITRKMNSEGIQLKFSLLISESKHKEQERLAISRDCSKLLRVLQEGSNVVASAVVASAVVVAAVVLATA